MLIVVFVWNIYCYLPVLRRLVIDNCSTVVVLRDRLNSYFDMVLSESYVNILRTSPTALRNN